MNLDASSLALRVPAPVLTAFLIALGVLALGTLGYKILFGVLRRFTEATATTLDDELVRKLRKPAAALIGLLSVHAYLAMRGMQQPAFFKAVVVIEWLLAAYVAIETVDTVFFFYWLGERKQIAVPAVVRHLALVLVYVAAALSILGSAAGINLVPLLATSTVVTVVVGLALQETLGNLFAGLALHIERPFVVGDWILIDGVEGQVIYMGWRSTRLKTFSGDVVALPNAIIARARVQNFNAPDRRCARNVEVLVATSASPEAVERAVARAAAKVERILPDPAPNARLIAFTPLFQRYVVKFWLVDFQFHDDTESSLLKALWHALREEGVALADAQAAPAVDPAQPGEAIAAIAPR